MMETKIKRNKAISGLFIVAAALGLLFFSFQKSQGQGFDCDDLSGDDKRKCEELEKKAKAYQDLIDIKNKQQTSIQNQLNSIDSEQKNNLSEIQRARSQAGELAENIERLEKNIEFNEAYINYQKGILAGLMRSYYEYYQQGVLGIILINKDFSKILNQADYVSQSSAKVKDILAEITETKNTLEAEQNDLISKKQRSDELQKELQERNDNLDDLENQKENLLAQTQGEEVKYQKLLERVEQQKLELFDFGTASNLSEILGSVGDYPRPDEKYWASTSWYFSQRDPRWGDKKIGNSNSLMRDYGCAVTAVSMAFKYYGASIDPGKMAKQPIYYYDLIKWPGSWSPDIELTSSISHGNISWSKIDSEISKKHLVIVYIRRASGGGHYVVIHGKDKKDYIVHDPYFGPNLYLSTSKSLVGKLGTNTSTTVDQMIIYN